MWVAIQRVGDTVVRVVAAAREQALAALAIIRMSLLDQLRGRELVATNQEFAWEFDHTAFAALTVADKFAMLTDAANAARATFEVRRRNAIETETESGMDAGDLASQIDYEIEVRNQSRSQHFGTVLQAPPRWTLASSSPYDGR